MATQPTTWWGDFQLVAQYGDDSSFQLLIDGAPDDKTRREISLATQVFKGCRAEKDAQACLDDVKLLLPQITGEVDEKAFRRSMRSFVPRLQLRFGAGIGNTVLTSTVEGVGTIRRALHECNPQEGHFDLSEECRDYRRGLDTDSNRGGGDDGWNFDGPNVLAFGLELAADIVHWTPNRLVRDDGDGSRLEIAETGHQIYGVGGLRITALPFEDGSGTWSVVDLTAGVGYRTDFTEVYDGNNSSIVLFPGFEAFGGFSTLNTENSGGTLGVRVLLPGWFFEEWALQSFADFSLHDFGDASYSNNSLAFYMTDDRVTPVLGLMVTRTLSEARPDRPVLLRLPRQRTIYVPANNPVVPVPEPAPPPPPVVLPGMVIALADLNFYTNLPTADQVDRFVRMQPSAPTEGGRWSLDDLRAALGNQIFEPTEYNLRVLEKIAQKLNEADILDYAIHIVGYTDGRGTEADNENLSLQRATIVREILVRLGVESARLVVEARGESEPKITEDPSLDPESLERARAANRRIEFRLGEKIRGN